MGRLAVVILAVSLLAISGFSHAAGTVLFGFEDDTGGWRVPDWALEKEDHVARDVAPSQDWASEGKKSMKVTSEYLAGKWSGAYVEIEEYYDWSAYSKLSVDIYIPKDAPAGLKGKMILTVGEEWKWTEMSKTVPLTPGQVTTITANLAPGSKDWKNTLVDDNFRKDVRKFGVRVENNKSEWKGMYYVDNIRLE
ncbi:MAG: glycan-binding surface protein [Candidatus Omnitrophota bacterium]